MTDRNETVHENFKQAKLAVEYVDSKMTIGAANKFSDVISSLLKSEWSRTCVARIRKEPYEGDAVISKLRSIAQRARDNGCGNCGEQAAIAFIWLMDKKVGPIDYMSRTNADHAFVVIGREGPIGDAEQWGNDCFVCDPWDGKAYSVHSVSEEMYGGGQFSPRSVARWVG